MYYIQVISASQNVLQIFVHNNTPSQLKQVGWTLELNIDCSVAFKDKVHISEKSRRTEEEGKSERTFMFRIPIP